MISKKKLKEQRDERTFRGELAGQLLTLSTAGFGLVAALAWNETVQTMMKEYIAPRIPGSGVLSSLIYAILVTCLAVFITYMLSKIAARFPHKKD